MKKRICRLCEGIVCLLLCLLPVMAGCAEASAVVVSGDAQCAAVGGEGICRTAAHTFSETIARVMQIDIPVLAEAGDSSAECFEIQTDDVTGDCGYAISVRDGRVVIGAASLTGFDRAIERLLQDCATGQGLCVAADYAVLDVQDWPGDYTLEGEEYNAAYRDDVFCNDKNDAVAYVTNAMWRMFGAIDDGQNLVYRFGNEPTWFEWMSEKIMWSGDAEYIAELKGKIRSFPQTSTGYMWSWGRILTGRWTTAIPSIMTAPSATLRPFMM